eukprot:6892502-Pyramimonas_sp.AAC.1
MRSVYRNLMGRNTRRERRVIVAGLMRTKPGDVVLERRASNLVEEDDASDEDVDMVFSSSCCFVVCCDRRGVGVPRRQRLWGQLSPGNILYPLLGVAVLVRCDGDNMVIVVNVGEVVVGDSVALLLLGVVGGCCAVWLACSIRWCCDCGVGVQWCW